MRVDLGLCLVFWGCVPSFPGVGPDVDAGPDACAPVIEQCNGVDDDCDGAIDEALIPRRCLGHKGVCLGAERACVDGDWGDCDGASHAGDLYREIEDTAVCDGLDNDCDGLTDENCECVDGATQACGLDRAPCEPGEQVCASGQWGECVGGVPPVDETCDGADEDCDGAIDEGTLNACGACGAVPAEICDGVDDDCDGAVDEGTLNACGACGAEPAEICDGVDDDCDGAIDEGTLNACGACGAVPTEICDGVDDDCDGAIDEGTLNACGACGAVPEEACNGVDDDCDGVIDEGRAERCDGLDNDCDGRVDEAVVFPLAACSTAPRPAPCNHGTRICVDGAQVCRSRCEVLEDED